MNVLLRGLAVAVTLHLLVGCAAARNWQQVDSPAAFRFKQAHSNVTLVVDPWLNGNDQQDAFGTRVTSQRILPLRVILYNSGESTIRFSSTQASVVFPGGETMGAMPKSKVAERIEGHESLAPSIILIATLGWGGIVAAPIAQGTAEENWKRLEAVRSTSMNLVRLDPGEAMSGFLFFNAGRLLNRKDKDKTHKLYVNRITRVDNEPLSFAVDFTLSN